MHYTDSPCIETVIPRERMTKNIQRCNNIAKNDPHMVPHKIRLKEILLFYAFLNGKAGASSLGNLVHLCI